MYLLEITCCDYTSVPELCRIISSGPLHTYTFVPYLFIISLIILAASCVEWSHTVPHMLETGRNLLIELRETSKNHHHLV